MDALRERDVEGVLEEEDTPLFEVGKGISIATRILTGKLVGWLRITYIPTFQPIVQNSLVCHAVIEHFPPLQGRVVLTRRSFNM